MRAAVCRAFGRPYELEEVDLAAPGQDELTVRLGATAICHSDIIFSDGGWGGELPAIYGHEGAGVADAVGPGVADIEPCDRVIVTMLRACGHCPCCSRGLRGSCEHPFERDRTSPISDRAGRPVVQGLHTAAFAERALVHRSQVVRIGPDLPFETASLLACGVITGFGAVANSARMRPESDVVVIGTGGVGLNSVQAAAILGARRVIAIDLSPAKLAAASAFGATHTVDPRDKAPGDAVRAITAGRGADYVFVTVGAKAAIDLSYDLLAAGGMAVLVGIPESGVTSTFDPVTLASASQQVIGSKLGAAALETDIPRLIELHRDGRLQLEPLITGRFGFDDINQAILAVRSGRGLKTVVLFDD